MEGVDDGLTLRAVLVGLERRRIGEEWLVRNVDRDEAMERSGWVGKVRDEVDASFE